MFHIRKQHTYIIAVILLLTYAFTTFQNTHHLPSLEHQTKENSHIPSNGSVAVSGGSKQTERIEEVTVDVESKNTDDDGRGNTVHIAYCLYGDHPGLMAEFEVSLKSVLLNAPRKSDLNIHLITDSQAHISLRKYFESSILSSWESNVQILIRVYELNGNNLQEIREWLKGISKFDMIYHHTIGTYFRLFVKDVLANDISHVLYMDIDVVIMSNLQDVWKHIDSNALFQWGENMCAGFLILNVQKMEETLKIIGSINYQKFRSESKNPAIKRANLNDQLFFVGVNVTHPEVVQLLPMEWDISIANGIWKLKRNIVEKRPNIGMIHFNGGGISTNAYFDEHDFITKDEFKGTFGLASYYVRLPWPWAKYMAKSQIGNDRSYTLKIEYSSSEITITPFPGKINNLRI